jgi:hypothetical protein
MRLLDTCVVASSVQLFYTIPGWWQVLLSFHLFKRRFLFVLLTFRIIFIFCLIGASALYLRYSKHGLENICTLIIINCTLGLCAIGHTLS